VEDPKETQNLIDAKPEVTAEMEAGLAKIFNIRKQKEHWFQMKYDVPGLCEERFTPVRFWLK
jgi:plasmid maintenance system antidote protein VapI